MKNILTFVEIKEGSILKNSLEAISAGKKIGDKVIATILENNEKMIEELINRGADEVLVLKSEKLGKVNLDIYVEALENVLKDREFTAFILGGTLVGKELASRLASRLEVGCVTDAIGLKLDENKNIIWTCSAYGGTLFSDMMMDNSKLQIGTIRSGAFKKLEEEERKGEVVSLELELGEKGIKTRIVDVVKEISETVDLESAEVIIAGGRGMGNADNFKLIEQLADLLGGVVGATRPAIEAGWISKNHQVGQSGKIVGPKLYIACGISGAVQHVSGMVGSDYIVAINKDEDAPIFDVANVGIVGNVMEALPIMINEIKQKKEN
ncbi:electron transfer flavoprotein subunit alpha/FixB family protein [Fusobacterium sp. MFO224]|uniref:electron transfer flavoprotein subunit alpha/FixB family protein n=1 Tax=Fusobacterium sp. MFO224 TaxID=3378070 RepID=UPI003854EBE4